MDLYPAIDLLGGKALRLLRGRYDEATVYDDDPAALAARWRSVALRLHVVDLEGARDGRPVQLALVRRIVEAFGSGVQVGGGARDRVAAAAILATGADRVVLGTAAVEDPAFVQDLCEAHPGRVVVAVDARDGLVATRGWAETTRATAAEVVRALGAAPVAAVLYTDISRDGARTGPNLAATAELASATGMPVLASGGVSSLDDLRALARIPGVAGAIVGRALYEGAFTVEEAVAAAR